MTNDRPQRLTARQQVVMEDRCAADILAIAEYLQAFREEITGGARWTEVAPGSSLADDDALSSPNHVSHGITYALMAACELLQANTALFTQANTIFRDAPFVLGRAAAEAACSAIWLMLPTERSDRIIRRLYLAREDIRSSVALDKHFTGSPPKRIEAQFAEVDQAASAAGVTLPKPGSVKTTTIITEVAASIPGRNLIEDPLGIWYAGSGFTHSRRWPSLNLFDREIVDTNDPAVVTIRNSSSPSRILWSLAPGFNLVKEGRQLFDQQRAGPD